MQLDVEAKELGVKLQLQTAQGCCSTSEKRGRKELLCFVRKCSTLCRWRNATHEV